MSPALRFLLLALLLTGWTACAFLAGVQVGAGVWVAWHRLEFALPHRFAPRPP